MLSALRRNWSLVLFQVKSNRFERSLRHCMLVPCKIKVLEVNFLHPELDEWTGHEETMWAQRIFTKVDLGTEGSSLGTQLDFRCRVESAFLGGVTWRVCEKAHFLLCRQPLLQLWRCWVLFSMKEKKSRLGEQIKHKEGFQPFFGGMLDLLLLWWFLDQLKSSHLSSVGVVVAGIVAILELVSSALLLSLKANLETKAK
ncbi:hypothetical protein HHK36_006353 [Tetracentron sinense]|uniref:Uncharacterized protein n=1 Tax=Tetracentron sinense TaxID=13715 RepID=A0A834ZPE4_TETSI|nr:hypothetical protein HHK36_006353 [Tetracentron sinense]